MYVVQTVELEMIIRNICSLSALYMSPPRVHSFSLHYVSPRHWPTSLAVNAKRQFSVRKALSSNPSWSENFIREAANRVTASGSPIFSGFPYPILSAESHRKRNTETVLKKKYMLST